jgi:hypothetical protein
MFETVVVYSSPGKPENDPIEWLTAPDGPRTTTDDCSRLIHQLDTLNPQHPLHLPVALRRPKCLKIFVSEIFRLSNTTLESTRNPSSRGRRDIESAVQQLMTTLPAIIRTLGNLRETT